MKIRYSKSAFILLLASLLMYAGKGFAQLREAASQGSLYAPPSPNASALLKYANVPVDEHTGIASVVLPIDQLTGRQLTAAVTLSYHGAGNKVQDVASNVGLGFVLNAGGVITRVMRGLPDESTKGYQYYGKKVSAINPDSVYLNATINSQIDGEPDLFYFNFMGHTGKLVVDTLGHVQYLPDQGMRVITHPIHSSTDSTQNAWILKDFTGTTYQFGTDTSAKEITAVNLVCKPVITYISSWYLTRVISADGMDTLNFSYSSGPNMSYKQYRGIITYNIQDNITLKRKGLFSRKVIRTDVNSSVNIDSIDVSTEIQVLSPKYLNKINNDMGWITFSYHSRDDVSGGQAIDQMKLYSVDDSATPLKTYTFNESYFISPAPADTTSPDSKRLRLNCVTLQGRSDETKQLFVFGYNRQTHLPPRNSDEFDHWGYYTKTDNRTGFPPAVLTTDATGNYDYGFDRRQADSVRMQADILTRIRNVNGGYTDLIYQANTYKFNGKTGFGGGLRIKTIIERDSIGQVIPITKNYTYVLDDGTTSGMVYNPKPYYIQGLNNYQDGFVMKPIPSLLSMEIGNFKNPLTIIGTGSSIILTALTLSSPVSLAINIGVTLLAPLIGNVIAFLFKRTVHKTTTSPALTISSTPLNNLFDINGASVTYSQVGITNTDGGKTINYYTSQQEYPDSSSITRLNAFAQPVQTIYGNVGSYPPVTSLDFERGLLKQSKVYDSSNNLVSTTTNTYQLSKIVSSVPGQRSSISSYIPLPDNTFKVASYDVGLYNEISRNIQLTQSVTQLFDQITHSNPITTTHSYTWQPQYPTLLRSESTLRSDGKLLVNYNTYPMEYAPGTTFLDNMVSHYMLATPIERVSTLQDGSAISITGGVLNRYKTGGLGLLDTVFSLSASNPIPLSNFKFSNQVTGVINGTYQAYNKDANYIAKSFYQEYDSKNNLIQSQNLGEPSSSTIWSYQQDVPVAQISNATVDKVAYTSFETNDQQYWVFTAAGRDSSGLAKTGKVRYQLSSGTLKTRTSLPAGTYIISLWTQGSKPIIDGTTADVSIVNGESDNHSWNFYMDRITVAGGDRLKLTGSGLIDEVRLYPQGAHISTLTISPQVGITSVASQDDKVNTTEYDAFQRVKVQRDDQFNILKEYTYSNVTPVPCVDTPDVWVGTSPECFTDQSNVLPDTLNYNAVVTNNFGNIICNFTRTAAEKDYVAEINYTVTFTDSTDYTSSVVLGNGDLATMVGLTGRTPESVSNIGIDTVINLANNYGVAFQRFQYRQRTRDGFTEANTLTGGIGIYVPPERTDTGCPTLFTNQAQTDFYKNNCSVGNGDPVNYTVAAGLYSAASQHAADSIARAVGQAYANAHGTCSSDTTFVGIDPYCTTSTADSGTPDTSAYQVTMLNMAPLNTMNIRFTRTAIAAAHDVTVTYTVHYSNGSTATYTTPMYKNRQAVVIMPPMSGYVLASVTGVAITGVDYTGLNRQAFTNRQRLIDGVPDGHTEANTAGKYYLAPLENPGACGTWFYNTAQTGFYRNNCALGSGAQVSYTVAAHTDSSTVSQSFADALARARGQVYANEHATCDTGAVVTTFAGTGEAGYSDGPLLSAKLWKPDVLLMDNLQNIYVSGANPLIQKMAGGTVSTLAGSTTFGYADGTGTSALFNVIDDITLDNSGNLYVCDVNNRKIRKVTPAGVVTTFAGSTQGYADGQGTAAKFDTPIGIATDASGNMYVSDGGNYRIRGLSTGGYVSTFAGNGTSGYVDGAVGSAEFLNPTAITSDGSGNIYVADNGRIRKISGGTVSTLAGDGTIGGFQDGTGTAAKFGNIGQMCTDTLGNIYLADTKNNCIRKVTPAGVVTTITTHSSGAGGYVNGPISTALFKSPRAVMIDANGNLYIGDSSNNVIRKITFPASH